VTSSTSSVRLTDTRESAGWTSEGVKRDEAGRMMSKLLYCGVADLVAGRRPIYFGYQFDVDI
jgi:hypothetical protein